MVISAAHWKTSLALIPPLIVALVVVAGLGWLIVENLNGSVAAHQSMHEHALAVRHLLFRR